ncbi:MAG TPA: YfcE family phosphodiesterase [bacterium (Candidatus Stahlbacteria)]|nr:YfcE family phosphodiesterase [Candidatus Stahlbacteria bacterium]
MKVGVLSDSHGNLEYLRETGLWLIQNGASLLVHLGDDWDDTKAVEELGIMILKVPGVFSSYYQDPSIINRRIEKLVGFQVLLTHTVSSHENDLPTDIKPEDVIAKHQADIILYGHTHIPNLEIKEGILWLNPGHLKIADKKGYGPSFGILDLREYEAVGKIIDLKTKDEIKSLTLSKR